MLRRQALGELRFGNAPGLLDGGLSRLELRFPGGSVLPQALELIVNRRIGAFRVRRRNERPWVELLVVPEGPLKPNRELARHPQLVKSLAVIALRLMNGGVSDPAQVVKQRPLRGPDRLRFPEAAR
ncbi:MAG TPA: hypothetical protein VGK73_16815 [Polyangiaceae bacterium]